MKILLLFVFICIAIATTIAAGAEVYLAFVYEDWLDRVMQSIETFMVTLSAGMCWFLVYLAALL